MRRVPSFALNLAIAIGLSAAAVAPGPSRAQPAEPPPAAAPKLPSELTADDLKLEIEAILRSGRGDRQTPALSEPRGDVRPLPAGDRKPPQGAAAIVAPTDGGMTPVRSAPARHPRDAAKAAAPDSAALPPPKTWRAVSFAGQEPYLPGRGVDQALFTPDAAARARGATYAFLIVNEYPSAEMEKQLSALGVRVLGRHAGALKVSAPLDPDRLKQIATLPFVDWIGYARPGQKLDPNLRAAADKYASELPGLPVTINAFDPSAVEELQALLKRREVRIGAVNRSLGAISAVVTARDLESLTALDSVLFIELNRPGGIGHDNSMAVMGADYIRPGGAGQRFSGAPARLGILDTGFMVGGAAATTHQDLNKFGCGKNFTSDAANVWNDQNGHGTHVLATISGTGTAEARFRGVATGVGSSGTTRIRGAKIWKSTGSGTQADEIEGQDYMKQGPDCGTDRPMLVSESGGASGTKQVGTDARSRGLDQIVWDTRQTWIVCGGNNGPGAGTIWSPGVAKNALAVGNALDTGDGTIGDISNSSSLGPAGDGRMKPNVVATGTVVTSARAGTTNLYTDKSGCSMATPHVSGVAATIMEHYPEFQTLPHLMRAHLMATALLHDNISAPLNNTPAPDTTRNTFGLGRVSPYVAQWAHLNSNGWATQWAWRTITDSRWGFRDIDVPQGTRRLVVVLTWDEPPASAGASAAVDYDLDLWIDRAPFCTPDSKGQCGEWASQSWIDNVEYQIIDNPPAGTYRLKIINWDAPGSGLPAAISATIIRGATNPPMKLAVNSTTAVVGRPATITTTVTNPSWILSGVHLASVTIPAGVTLQQVRTVREDNVTMDFTAAKAMSLGNIVQGDSRSATWRFNIDTPGPKTFRFRAWSENGGAQEQSITLNP